MNKKEAAAIIQELTPEEKKILFWARWKPGDLLASALADSQEQFKAYESLIEKGLLKKISMPGMVEITQDFRKVQVEFLNFLLRG